MSWTYSGNPASSDQDAVRFQVQDTDPASPLVQDEEIAFALDQEATVIGASAMCLEVLARRYARLADVELTSGDAKVKRSYGTMAAEFAKRAAELRARAAGGGLPWYGGGSLSRKDGLAAEADRVQPTFRRGQFGTPGL